MKKTMQRISGLLTCLMLLYSATVPAQTTDSAWLADLAVEEREALDALVLYPAETRQAILEVALYPESLIKMESIQRKAKTAFQSLLEKHPQSTQEFLWDLTRYPGLIEQLVAVRDHSSREITQVLEAYPEVIRDRATEALRFYAADLVEIDRLNRKAEAAFETLLTEYPVGVQASLRHLLDFPEVLSILTENIKLTILVGDLYVKDPQRVLQQADSLNLVVARRQAEELADWKQSLEEDPEARAQLEASAEAFKEEHDYLYDDEYYEPAYDDIYYEEPEAPEVRTYYFYHYPYWFSYPHWYTYPRWRAYPYWYDWGFYFGPRRSIVVIGLPSFSFVDWYFYHPYHHYRWAHLSARFTRHYYTHRRHGSTITAGVSVWQRRNRAIVSDNWLRDDGRLQDRFREFGKFEADRARYNRNHPQRTLNQEEFRDRNPERYRTIITPRRQGRTVEPDTERRRIPIDTEPRATQDRQPRRTVIRPRQTEPAPRTKADTPRSTVPKVKQGAERHRSISERSKTTTRTAKPTTPRTKAPRTTGTKKTPRKKKND